jgi:hypothetical protein
MNEKIKNTFWFRHFLMCTKVANLMLQARGWGEQNFAQLTVESENGRFGNEQMIIYFTKADEWLSELHCSEEGELFENLEYEGVSMETLSNLSLKDINDYYDEYCIGRIDFSNLKDVD